MRAAKQTVYGWPPSMRLAEAFEEAERIWEPVYLSDGRPGRARPRSATSGPPCGRGADGRRQWTGAGLAGRAVATDLAAETDALVDDPASESALAELPADWELPTPAAGWTIRDQVTHLAYFDDAARLAAHRPGAVPRRGGADRRGGAGFVDQVAGAVPRHCPPADVLAWFDQAAGAS